MPKEREMTIEAKIYAMLTYQRFVDWHDLDFSNHIEGVPEAKTKMEILEDIRELLGP